jgi:hypothetical protein
VVILGSGFGGLHAAQALAGIDMAGTVSTRAAPERHPATATMFAEHGMDLCRGGEQTRVFAAKTHGVELPLLLAELEEAAVGAGWARRYSRSPRRCAWVTASRRLWVRSLRLMW